MNNWILLFLELSLFQIIVTAHLLHPFVKVPYLNFLTYPAYGD